MPSSHPSRFCSARTPLLYRRRQMKRMGIPVTIHMTVIVLPESSCARYSGVRAGLDAAIVISVVVAEDVASAKARRTEKW